MFNCWCFQFGDFIVEARYMFVLFFENWELRMRILFQSCLGGCRKINQHFVLISFQLYLCHLMYFHKFSPSCLGLCFFSSSFMIGFLISIFDGIFTGSAAIITIIIICCLLIITSSPMRYQRFILVIHSFSSHTHRIQFSNCSKISTWIKNIKIHSIINWGIIRDFLW